MANFKFVINEPETKKSFQVEVDQEKAVAIIGKKIGEEISADFLGLAGYTLQITGGADKDGFPMLASVKGSVRKRVLLSGPPGFHPDLKGQRRRKNVRGNTVSDEIVQINAKIVTKGEKQLAEIFPAKEKSAKQEEVKTEKPEKERVEKTEEKKVEKKEEVGGGEVPAAAKG